MLKKYLLLMALSSACAVGIDDVPADEQSTEQDMDASDDDASNKQNGGAVPSTTPTATDYAQLPFSIKLVPQPQAGWSTGSSLWVEAIWPRNASGAWYRARAISNWDLYIRDVFPTQYSCVLVQSPYIGYFRCRDYRGAVREYPCPVPRLSPAPSPSEWRSSYNDYAPRVGLFYWTPESEAKWKAWGERLSFPLYSMSVTDNGKQINCGYRVPTFADNQFGTDVWLQAR